MKTSQWGKTLLYTYKYLPRIADAIDKMVNRTALNSFYYYDNSQKNNGVLAVSERIIDLIERKRRLVNIKVLVDKALLACEQLDGAMLVEKYIDNDISEDIATRHNMNIRTYFRKIETAETSFNRHLIKLGFDENRLREYLAEEKWILEVLDNFQKQSKLENETVDCKEKFVGKI